MKSRKWPSLNWKNTWLPGQSRGQYVPINRIKSLRAVKTGISPECDLSFFRFFKLLRVLHHPVPTLLYYFRSKEFVPILWFFYLLELFQIQWRLPRPKNKTYKEKKYTKKRTMLTKSSKPKSVPVISLSFRMIMWIRDPIHLSTNSNGINWDAIFSIWTVKNRKTQN